MNKFLLALGAAAIASSSMMAETVTFDFTSETYGLEVFDSNSDSKAYNAEGTEIVISPVVMETIGNTRIWNATAGQTFRFYKNSGMTIKVDGGVVTGVTLEGKDVNTANFTVGGMSATSWTGNAESVDIKCLISKSSANVSTITVDYETSDKTPSGLSFEKRSYDIPYLYGFEAPVLNNPNNLAVTYTSSNEEVATVNANGQVSTTGVIGSTVITATSAETEEFAAGKASYTLNVRNAAASLREWMEICPNSGDEAMLATTILVTYVNGEYVYITDYDRYGLIYSSTTGYKSGDYISSPILLKRDDFKGLVEMKPEGEVPAASANWGAPDPVSMDEVTEDNINQVVVLKNVTLAEAFESTKNFQLSGTMSNGNSIVVYNKWSVEGVPAGSYNITCAVSTYNGTIQVFPIEFAEVSEVEKISVNVTINGNPANYVTKYGDCTEYNFDFKLDSVDDLAYFAITDLTPGYEIWYTSAQGGGGFFSVPRGYELYTGPIELPVGTYSINWVYAHEGEYEKDGEPLTDYFTGMANITIDAKVDFPDLSGIRVTLQGQEGVENWGWYTFPTVKLESENQMAELRFEDVPEGVSVYAIVDDNEGGGISPFAAKRSMSVGSLIGKGAELVENNVLYLPVGDFNLNWFYCKDGMASNDWGYSGSVTVEVDGSGVVTEILPTINENVGEYDEEEGVWMFLEPIKVASEDAVAVMTFENLPETYSVYYGLMVEPAGGGMLSSKANRMSASDLEEFGMQLAENNRIEIPVGQFYVAWYFVENGETVSGEDMDGSAMGVVEYDSSAVEMLGVENGEASYYDLNGRRVVNPVAGLYIRVANGKATKVVVK